MFLLFFFFLPYSVFYLNHNIIQPHDLFHGCIYLDFLFRYLLGYFFDFIVFMYMLYSLLFSFLLLSACITDIFKRSIFIAKINNNRFLQIFFGFQCH